MSVSRLNVVQTKWSSWHLDVVPKRITVISDVKLASSISHMRTAREDGRVRFKFLMPFEIPWVNRVRRISRVTSELHIDVKEVDFSFCITQLVTEQNGRVLATTLPNAISWMKIMILELHQNIFAKALLTTTYNYFRNGFMPSANIPLFGIMLTEIHSTTVVTRPPWVNLQEPMTMWCSHSVYKTAAFHPR